MTCVTVSVTPNELRLPNHKYRTVMATPTASADTVDVALASATSSEPDDGLGDGDTASDIVIIDDLTVHLRAERSGTGTERTYTLTFRATNSCGRQQRRRPPPSCRCRMRGTEPPLLPCCADATGEYSPVETTAPNARVPAVCDTPRVAVAQDTVNQSPGDDRQRTRRRRLADAIIGHPATRRLALAHAVDDFSDSMINLSLLGSLFFSVSLEASQGRILTYLLLTAAPLAIAAPAIGPLLDRWRAGYRSTILGSQAVRAVLSVAVAGSLQSLAFYPLVFGILLSRKAYALAKTAIVADLVPDRNDLVTASGHLARTGTVAGGIGTAIAGLLILLIGVEWLPVVGAGSYLVAAVVSSTLPVHRVEGRPAAVIVRAETPLDVKLATLAVALIRAAAGALTFLLAFAIKRGGGDEWIYASALVVAGGGSFVGTMVAPRLHRALASDRIVALTLLGPAVVTAFGVLTVGNFSIIAIAFAIGLGSSISSRAMDGFYGRVPLLVRGRAISFSELVDGAVDQGARGGGMAAEAIEAAHAGGDAPVLEDGGAAGGLTDDDAGEGVGRVEEGLDAAGAAGLFIGAEEHGRIAPGALGGDEEAGRGTFDVGRAEADGPVALDTELQRVHRPARVGRDSVDVHVEEERGCAPHGEEAEAAVAQIAERAGKG